MSKGIENIIMIIILISMVIVLVSAVFVWNQRIGKNFEDTARSSAEKQSQKYRTNFFIVNAAGNQVGVKNNGEVAIKLDDFTFYLNSTFYSNVIHQSVSPDVLNPSQIAIFNITGNPPYNGNYTVKATGPYGITDEIFAEMYGP